jgi:hypothetical protein
MIGLTQASSGLHTCGRQYVARKCLPIGSSTSGIPSELPLAETAPRMRLARDATLVAIAYVEKMPLNS